MRKDMRRESRRPASWGTEGDKKAFIKEGKTFNAPLEVVISGGTSKPIGFCDLVEKVIQEVGWPFDISGVRGAKEPLHATALGCLTAATSRERKLNKDKASQKNENMPDPENKEKGEGE